MRILGYLIGNG